MLMVGLSGSVVTLTIFLGGVVFNMGRHSARIDELEKWRGNVRLDMHEISEKLETVISQLSSLATMVQERTDRRFRVRPVACPIDPDHNGDAA